MRSWTRENSKFAVVAVTSLATVVTILGWAVPNARDWMADHGGMGWTLAIILAMAAVFTALAADARLAASQAAVVALQEEAQRSDSSHRQQLAEQASMAQAELDASNSIVAELRAKTSPSQRDQDQFRELLDAWPWGTGLLFWLNHGFNARRWTSVESDPLFNFEGEWRERFFDDSEVQSAFAEFYAAVAGLTSWMARNGAPDLEENRHRSPDAPTVYTIADGSERSGGWPEMDNVRDEALAFVQQIFDLRRPLEEAGRRRGL